MYIPVLQERDAAATTTVSAGEGDEAGPLGLSIPTWTAIGLLTLFLLLLLLLCLLRRRARAFPGPAWRKNKVKCAICTHPIPHTAQHPLSANFLAYNDPGWFGFASRKYTHWSCRLGRQGQTGPPRHVSAAPPDKLSYHIINPGDEGNVKVPTSRKRDDGERVSIPSN